VLSQGCDKVATRLLQIDTVDKVVTRLPQGCHKVLSQGCDTVATRLLQIDMVDKVVTRWAVTRL
jgi:hypothetical protein